MASFVCHAAVLALLPALLLLLLLAACCATVQVELIDGQWHNLPRFPTFIREFNGLMMGSLPHLTLPLWSWTLEFVGDDFYKRERQQQAGRKAY